MFHFVRRWHRTIGLVASIFLFLLAVTGVLLALKGQIPALRPPERQAEKVATLHEVVPLGQVLDSVLALNLPMLTSHKDIDRIDYRPKSNIFKVVSKTAYKEVQVDGKTGQVLGVSDRNDQFIENIHDLSIFHDLARIYWLPIVGVGLGILAVTGIWIYVDPILRRRRFKKKRDSGTPMKPKA